MHCLDFYINASVENAHAYVDGCPIQVSEVIFVITSTLKDVCGKPPTERMFLDKYGKICLSLDEVVWGVRTLPILPPFVHLCGCNISQYFFSRLFREFWRIPTKTGSKGLSG